MQVSTNASKMSIGSNHRTWGWIAGLSFGATLIGAVALSIANGPETRANAQALIDRENEAVCGKLGIGPGTSRYPECAAALSDVRSSAVNAAAQSIL